MNSTTNICPTHGTNVAEIISGKPCAECEAMLAGLWSAVAEPKVEAMLDAMLGTNHSDWIACGMDEDISLSREPNLHVRG